MGGVDQALVKHQVARDVGIDIAVKVPGTALQRFAQLLQIVIGTAYCGQTDGFGFQYVAGFTGLLGRAPGHGLYGL
ncbi:hypothetical protein D3C79_958950 [compost metagenome]